MVMEQVICYLENLKLNPYFLGHKRTNSKWIRHLKVKSENHTKNKRKLARGVQLSNAECVSMGVGECVDVCWGHMFSGAGCKPYLSLAG